MPVRTAKKAAKQVANGVTSAAETIREHWSRQEAHRRREMAELMQHRLMEALRLVHAPINRPR